MSRTLTAPAPSQREVEVHCAWKNWTEQVVNAPNEIRNEPCTCRPSASGPKTEAKKPPWRRLRLATFIPLGECRVVSTDAVLDSVQGECGVRFREAG
jgi:hypothetical protein